MMHCIIHYTVRGKEFDLTLGMEGSMEDLRNDLKKKGGFTLPGKAPWLFIPYHAIDYVEVIP